MKYKVMYEDMEVIDLSVPDWNFSTTPEFLELADELGIEGYPTTNEPLINRWYWGYYDPYHSGDTDEYVKGLFQAKDLRLVPCE